MPFCPDCGKEVSEDTRFCPECGRPLTAGKVIVGEVVKGKNKKKIAGIIAGCIIAIIVITVIATHPPTSIEPGPAIPTYFTTYTDELGLFSISYPPEWEPALEYMEGLEQVSEDIINSITSDLPIEEASFLFMAGLPTVLGFDPNVNVVVEPLPGITWTHDQVVTAEIEGLKTVVSDYQELSRVKTIIDNRTATIIEWQGNIAGFGTVHDIQMMFIVSKTVWVVTCTASPDEYSEWEDDFDAVVRSLRILK
jgi:hypothetical protein